MQGDHWKLSFLSLASELEPQWESEVEHYHVVKEVAKLCLLLAS